MGAISRYTEWAVISRTVIIDRFINQKIKEGVDTIINLGAGLDTRPYRMTLPSQLRWVEADYLNIIEHKNKLLGSERPNCNLMRLAVDLSDGHRRRSFLAEATSSSQNVLVLTEGVIPYLSSDQVEELGKDLLAQRKIQYWIAEYLDPKVYLYLKRTVRTLKMKNAPFKFYPDDWYGFFKKNRVDGRGDPLFWRDS
jgi:O-methyltransferase involved in polyketide biosynthesis